LLWLLFCARATNPVNSTIPAKHISLFFITFPLPFAPATPFLAGANAYALEASSHGLVGQGLLLFDHGFLFFPEHNRRHANNRNPERNGRSAASRLSRYNGGVLNLRRSCILFVFFILLSAIAVAQAPGTQTVLILPFDDSTHQPGLAWIAEAFPEVLGQRLKTEALYLISRDDRQYAFDRMGIPVNLHASRATLYRIAAQLDADYIVLGNYSFDGQTFTARAQVLDMKALRLSRDLVESGPLDTLIGIQTALAWDVLRELRPGFSEPREAFLQHAPAIHLNAFESFIRGVAANSASEKVRYLKAALAIDPQYSEAALLLAKTYFAQHEYEPAAVWFAKIPPDDASFSEANFLLGLSEYHLGHFDRAATAFMKTAERVPLTEVLNNIGVAESRRGHRDAADYFQKAVQADPADADYHFNLAVALYRRGDISGAQHQLREALSRAPNDSDARQFQESLAASLVPGAVPPRPVTVPLTRIKRNYDESSYRQLAVELQNAIDASIGKAKPSERASLHLERAREFLASGAASEAESQFREVLTQQPESPVALAGLAHSLLLEGKFPEARRQAAAALARQPSAEAYLVLARADLHDQDRTAAGQNLQKALALEPANEDAKAFGEELQKQNAGSTQIP
jgi:tetratricopeptide (TPR) repeat protein